MPGYILGTNLSDAVTITKTTSGTMLLPLTGMQTKWAKGLTRGPANGTAFAAATLTIRLDFGASELIHGIAALGLNGVDGSTMQVKLSTVAAGGYEVASSNNVWQPTGSNDTLGQNIFWFPPGNYVFARYLELGFTVEGRPSGERYVDIRRLLVMRGCVLPYGFDAGWSINAIDQSTEILTPQGGVFVNEEGVYRQMAFSLTGLDEDEAKKNNNSYNNTDSLERVLQNYGKRKEVIVSPRHFATDRDQTENTVYGRLAEWSPIRHRSGVYYDCESITVNEVWTPPLS